MRLRIPAILRAESYIRPCATSWRLSARALVRQGTQLPYTALQAALDRSARNGSAREPQRLSRRRFLLGPPRIVASLMVAPASLAVRCFRPPVACDDRPPTTLTADDVRIDDEMVPDPLVDPIALVTDGGDASRIDLVEKVVHLNAPGSSPPRPRRTWRRRHPPCRDGAAAALCGRALELAAKGARARSPR